VILLQPGRHLFRGLCLKAVHRTAWGSGRSLKQGPGVLDELNTDASPRLIQSVEQFANNCPRRHAGPASRATHATSANKRKEPYARAPEGGTASADIGPIV
jgi:hypothetical protein